MKAREQAPRKRGAAWLLAAAFTFLTPVLFARTQDVPPAAGQSQPIAGELIVPLRVRNPLGDGRAAVDRGSQDGLCVGDDVEFLPRTGGRWRARVVRVEGRSAIVEALDTNLVFEPGMRGEVRVPLSRLESTAPQVVTEDVDPDGEPDGAAEAPDAALESVDVGAPGAPGAYENRDEDWRAGMPLLAGVHVPRPSERRSSITGRLWSSFDAIFPDEPGRSDTFVRSGIDVEYENPFAEGGRLQLDAEWNSRRTRRADEADLADSTFRVERFSYAVGGTRFQRDRVEVGRFLQRGLPQLGVVDGVEWSRREPGASGFGVSLGFMPEPDRDYQSGHDFQIAGWYRWVSDSLETASAAVGYQKTWHDGNADRDLVVVDGHYLPGQGWRYFATLWVDLYTSGDEAKGSGAEVTQAIATATRDFGTGNTLDLVYSRLAYPELDRNEVFPIIDPDVLADEAVDRLGADTWFQLMPDTRVLTRLGVWQDADENGGDAELGAELAGLFGAGSRLRSSIYGTDGEFTSSLGGRLGLGVVRESTSFDLSYELANQRQKGFGTDNDDFLHQRLRLGMGWRPTRNFSVSAHVETILRDNLSNFAGGVYAQWTF